MDRDTFISYIEEDGAVARALASELRTLGQSTWTYEEDGVAGISYLTQVHGAIEGCRAFVLLASPASVKAHQVSREVEQAHEREKIIIVVRIGLSHQQFIASNPILRMASGTAVTLAAEKENLPEIAKRITATLKVAHDSHSPTAPTSSEAQSFEASPGAGTVAAAPIETKVMGQSGVAALPSRVSVPDAKVAPNAPPDSPLWLRNGTSATLRFFVWVGLVVPISWSGLLAFIWAFSPTEDAGQWLLPVPALGIFISSLLLAQSCARLLRSSATDAKTQFPSLRRLLLLVIISTVVLSVVMVYLALTDTAAPLASPDAAIFVAVSFGVMMPLVLCIALVWNGLRVLQRAADAASR